jgi:hypothetical protein
LTLANDLAKRGQLQSAADNYRDAIAADPRLADAHLGLSRVSERLSGKSAAGLDDAAKELRAFVDLNKNMPDAQRQKDLKRIEALQMRAAKIRLRESASAKQTS